MTDVTMVTGGHREGDLYLFLDMDMAILASGAESKFVKMFYNVHL